jgi:quinohemoprotein ethanol dehydrogenase
MRKSRIKPMTRHAPKIFLVSALALCAAVMGCRSADDATTENADWLSYGRDAAEQRFSPLTQVSLDNVGQLGLAWSMDLPEASLLEGTPLEVDGTLFFTANLAKVWAVDARTGKEIWRYDPEPYKYNAKALRTTPGNASRGLAYYKGNVIIASTDGRLISLNAKTGKVGWTANTIEDTDSRKMITGAPRVFGDKVIIGHSGADYGTRGYVTTYDARTGKQLWRFYTVPGDPSKGFENDAMRMAAKTWSGEWWRWGGGGTVWNAITYDPDMNRLYIGVGNSSNYNPADRSPGGGDNLFLASIVALDADTGKYLWHYQVNPREAWDFKATADIVLADLQIDGRKRKVLMQAPTNGFFYVLDRETGKLISANKFEKATWADHIDLKTGRPVEAPNIRYENGKTILWPSAFGAHNWQAMSFNPQTGLVYIPTLRMGGSYEADKSTLAQARTVEIGSKRFYFGVGMRLGTHFADKEDGTGALTAYDPVAAKVRWKIPLPTPWNGGTVTTAGNLVFQGTASGWLYAFDARTGKQVWKYDCKNGIEAPPITYAIDGEQYLAILVGGGNPNAGRTFDAGWRYQKHMARLLVFKIGGTASLPATAAPFPALAPADVSKLPLDTASAARGMGVWNGHCLICHGVAVEQTSPIAPDLRESAAAEDINTFRQILLEGGLAMNGMPKFDDLDAGEIADLQMYIRQQAREAALPQDKRKKRPDVSGG